VAGGDQTWPKPVGIGDELAVHITNDVGALCGNEIIEEPEQCDDGNEIDGDGCDSNCTFTGCGNGIVTAGEQCDDGNLEPGDGCEPDCTVAVFQLLSGRRIAVRDRDGAPAKRRLSIVSRDPAIPAPALAGPGDPTLGGGVLRLANPSSGEEALFSLAASGWKVAPQPQGALGYVYREPRPSSAPCKKVVVRDGRLLRIICRGEGIDFTLNEPTQGSLSLSLQLGNDPPVCLSFGGRVIRDFGTGPRPLGRFVARDSPAPVECPLP
jgi:cysteine-rich repeat protein